MKDYEMILFVISGLLIISWFIWAFLSPIMAIKRETKIRSRECDCELDNKYCNNQIHVSNEGAISVPNYHKCPKFMASVFGKSNITKITIETADK